jgi:hypothetical protein
MFAALPRYLGGEVLHALTCTYKDGGGEVPSLMTPRGIAIHARPSESQAAQPFRSGIEL